MRDMVQNHLLQVLALLLRKTVGRGNRVALAHAPPDHGLIRHPPIIRRSAAPVLISGGVFSDEAEFKILTLYKREASRRPALEIASYALSEDDFDLSLLVASIDFLPPILRTMRVMQ